MMDASSSDDDDNDGGFNPFFQQGEVDLEFDPMVGNDDEEDDYWLSEQQDKEMRRQNDDTPKAHEWNDVPMEELKQMSVTIDRARKQVFNQAKTEIIDILQKGWDEASPSFEKLAEKTFGKRSRLFLLLLVELDVNYPTYCRFMATFFAACQRKMPVSQMLKDRRLDKTGFVLFVEYSKLLRRIESIGGNEDTGTVGEPLWMKLEDAYNTQVKDIFLQHRDIRTQLCLSLDDDKQKYNYSKTANTFGLLRTRHIQKNRFGVNLHTAATAATCIVVCVMYQRQTESLVQIYERMLRFMFGDRTGYGPLNLQGITLATDRGYWTAVLLFPCYYNGVRMLSVQ